MNWSSTDFKYVIFSMHVMSRLLRHVDDHHLRLLIPCVMPMPWSLVTPGSSGDEEYGDIQFIVRRKRISDVPEVTINRLLCHYDTTAQTWKKRSMDHQRDWEWSRKNFLFERKHSSIMSRISQWIGGDCVNDVQIISLQYCSDQYEIHTTVVKSFVPMDVPLVRS